MGFDWTIEFSNVAIICATFFGPIAAVQIQKYLEKSRENKERKLAIFRILMTTRGTPIAQAHVEALNSIPIEFYGTGTGQGSIIDKWKKYYDHLNVGDNSQGWHDTRAKMFAELLQTISEHLGYRFAYDELKKAYTPIGHAAVEIDEGTIRAGLAKVFRGEFNIPLEVKSIVQDENILKELKDIRKLLIEWLGGKSAVNVDIKNSDGANSEP